LIVEDEAYERQGLADLFSAWVSRKSRTVFLKKMINRKKGVGSNVNAHWKTYFFEHRPDLQKLIIIIAAGGLSAWLISSPEALLRELKRGRMPRIIWHHRRRRFP
jgi:hypothetical protein